MKALKILEPGKAAVVETKIPSLRPDYVLVKTVAVALNPTDWKHIGFVETHPTVGCDFAGIVEEVGSDVTKPWKKGDHIFGFAHGGNAIQEEDGADGEYLVAKGDIAFKKPDHLSFEEAATLTVGLLTVTQGLYQTLKLPWPNAPVSPKDKFPILIYGGSTATGALGIQFAKLSGLEVITTCSAHNFDYVKSLGADAVFDYSSPTVGADIRKYTDNKLYYVWDTISEHGSWNVAADALSSSPPEGHKLYYGAILTVKEFPREDVEQSNTVGYTVKGEYFEFRDQKWDARPEDFEFMKNFSVLTQKLLDEKKIRPHKHELRSGGLDGILDGLADLKAGKVSGVKLVYRISDP